MKKEVNNEIEVLKGSKSEIKNRIVKTDVEKAVLENTTQDEQNKVLEPHIYSRIDQQVKDLYALAVDKAEGKMGNANVLQLLNEVEKAVDAYLMEYNVCESINQGQVHQVSKDIKKG